MAFVLNIMLTLAVTAMELSSLPALLYCYVTKGLVVRLKKIQVRKQVIYSSCHSIDVTVMTFW